MTVSGRKLLDRRTVELTGGDTFTASIDKPGGATIPLTLEPPSDTSRHYVGLFPLESEAVDVVIA